MGDFFGGLPEEWWKFLLAIIALLVLGILGFSTYKAVTNHTICVGVFSNSCNISPEPNSTATSSGSYVSLASGYRGTVHNTILDKEAAFTLSSVDEDQQGHIWGEAVVHPPLKGYGHFTGWIGKDHSIQFEIRTVDGSEVLITFTGVVKPDHSLSGFYMAEGHREGTWKVV